MKLFFLLAILSIFVACKDDDDCKRSDWLGDYSGIIYYNHIFDQDSTGDARITVREDSGDFLVFEYETSITVAELDSLYPRSDCNIISNGSEFLRDSTGSVINLSGFNTGASLFKDNGRLVFEHRLYSGGVDTFYITIDATRE